MYATIAADRDSDKIKAIKKLEAAAACVGTEDFPLPLYFNQLEKLKTYISEETVEPEDEKAQEFLVQQLSRLENVGCRPRGILKANAACQTGAVHCEQTYALSTFAMSCESRNAEGEILTPMFMPVEYVTTHERGTIAKGMKDVGLEMFATSGVVQLSDAKRRYEGVDVIPAYVIFSKQLPNTTGPASDHHYIICKTFWLQGSDDNKGLEILFHDGMAHGANCTWQTADEYLQLDNWVVNTLVFISVDAFNTYALRPSSREKLLESVVVRHDGACSCPLDCNIAGLSWYRFDNFLLDTGYLLHTGTEMRPVLKTNPDGTVEWVLRCNLDAHSDESPVMCVQNILCQLGSSLYNEVTPLRDALRMVMETHLVTNLNTGATYTRESFFNCRTVLDFIAQLACAHGRCHIKSALHHQSKEGPKPPRFQESSRRWWKPDKTSTAANVLFQKCLYWMLKLVLFSMTGTSRINTLLVQMRVMSEHVAGKEEYVAVLRLCTLMTTQIAIIRHISEAVSNKDLKKSQTFAAVFEVHACAA